MRSSGGGIEWKLADHPKLPKDKTVAVVVLDGWGEASPNQYNCIHAADTPTMDSLKKVSSPVLIRKYIYYSLHLKMIILTKDMQFSDQKIS